VRDQLSQRIKDTIIAQPENKGTGPGIFLPLIFLHGSYPEATVVIFPTDHYILGEEVFMNHIKSAGKKVEQNPFQWILLVSLPSKPEPEFGYILPNQDEIPKNAPTIKKVWRFIEKPGVSRARGLIKLGAFWNTFIMVFKTSTFLNGVASVKPDLFNAFLQIRWAIGTIKGKKVIHEVYGGLESVDFSKSLLEEIPCQTSICLSVLPITGVFWNDLGSEERPTKIIRKKGSNWKPANADNPQNSFWEG
jgi:mannose-1-phosphate guanylyltransferase